MNERTCTICGAPEQSRGWCSKHYIRWYRHGDPLHGEYDLPAMTSGVYSITCTANGWVYIGSSGRVRTRWAYHKSTLRNGKHKNPIIQADWDEHGAEAFVFELITEVADNEQRYAAEQEHLNPAWLTGRCYNLSPSARDNTGHRFTPEQARKVSEALAGKAKSAEHRANLWRDREVTPEHREQMRQVGAAGKGVPKSAEHRRKIGDPQRGSGNHAAKLTEEQVRDVKRRLADKVPGRTLARELDVSEAAISDIKHGRRWAHVTVAEPSFPPTLF